MLRGGQPYRIPVGWKRYAIKVSHKWLPQIFREGLRAGPTQAFAGQCGIGIYCSPNIATAERYCGIAICSDGQRTQKMKFMLQCRVRPEAIKCPNPATIRLGTDAIWVINDTQDIRPYGVLVKFL